MRSNIVKFALLFVAICAITSCNKNDEGIDKSIGVTFEDYIGKDVMPIPDNVIELLAESPCWKIEKVEYANVVDGKYYTPTGSSNYYIGVSFLDSIFVFDKNGSANWYYYVIIGKWSDNNLLPQMALQKTSKILYYDGEEMIFTNSNEDNSEYGVPIFFTKVGNQEILDKWVKQIKDNQ
ncbi:MAG: hypothetical protein IJZ49_09220 [Alistipes sp.]|nr:hypothetical protein [Alistipes sp.]